MDSGNSGSISSSDEEYDSQADPWFLNHLGSISHPQPSLLPSHPHPSIFDLSSTYLQPLSDQSHPNPILDSHAPRSEPNCTLPSSSTTPIQHPSPPTNNLVRNSKKRSRASRRAPTTVLTTDTTNFRSMVQEFTGIPAPPFSGRFPLRPNPLFSTSSRTLLQNTPNNTNSINYQLLPDLSLPYQPHHNTINFHPFLVPAGFAAKSLSMPVLDDHHAHLVPPEGMFLRSDGGTVEGGRRDSFRCLDGNNYGSSCKLNMSVSAASSTLNHENNVNSPTEGAVEAWLCSSHQ